MRAFVTGAGGFVGRHLCAHLRSRGDEVVAVDREVDVTDPDAVRRALELAEPQVIYHLAALSDVAASWRDPGAYVRVNVEGTATVLDEIWALAPSALTLLVSSADVYGRVGLHELPLDESHELAPVSPYATSKAEAEARAFEAMARGQRVLVVRPFNHLGPGQSTSFVVPALAQRLLDARDSGAPSIAVGDLSARRDFTDVRDVVRAYRDVVTKGRAGEVYHVASNHDVAIETIAHALRDRVAPDVTFERDPSLLRPVELPVTRGDYAKLTGATGWSPTITLDTSLDDVVAELVARRETP